MSLVRWTLPTLLLLVASPAFANPLPTPIWVESGGNLVFDPSAHRPALTEGRGDIINLPNILLQQWILVQPTGHPPGNLPAGQTSETFPANFLTGSTYADGGQYYCYIVEGNAATTDDFSPSNWSFACAQVPPDTDNSPSSTSQVQGLTPVGPLQANANFSSNTWDAGFVGSIFRLDGGGGWQPWFRNGEEVTFDMPEQAPQANPLQPPLPPLDAYLAVSVDPGFYLGAVSFVFGGPAQQTLQLPPIFGTGYAIELQLSSSNTSGRLLQPYPYARVGVLGGDGQYIGEATVGATFAAGPPGPRLSTYRIDASNIIWTYPNTSLTFDMTGHMPALNQTVAIAAVVHGYHEQLLK